MKVSLGRHLEIIWLAIRKPYLFGPAVTIHHAIVKGKAEGETQFVQSNGRKRTISYRVVANNVKENSIWT